MHIIYIFQKGKPRKCPKLDNKKSLWRCIEVCQQNKGKNQERWRHGIQDSRQLNVQWRTRPRCSRAGRYVSPQEPSLSLGPRNTYSRLRTECLSCCRWINKVHSSSFQSGKRKAIWTCRKDRKTSQESHRLDMKQTNMWLDLEQLMGFKERDILLGCREVKKWTQEGGNVLKQHLLHWVIFTQW